MRRQHGQPLGMRGLIAAGWRLGLATLVVTLPLSMLTHVLPASKGVFLFDFRGDLYFAGRAILHGLDPYHPNLLAHLAAIKRDGGSVSTWFAVPAKPAPVLLAFLPLTLGSYQLGGILFIAGSVAGLFAGLRMLGVRDWRCFAVALASWPVVWSLYLANASVLLILGCAVAWRWRERLWPPAVAIASIVVLKLFPWPLGFWLLMTRRIRTLALSVAIAAGAVLLGWGVIGFSTLATYPRMLSDLSFVLQGTGPSFVSLLLAVGCSAFVAKALAVSAGATLVLLAWRFARQPNGESRAFGLVVAAALVASPHIWEHYVVLLFVPIALCSPSLSAIWFAPLITYLAPTPNGHQVWSVMPYVALQAIVIGWLLVRPWSLRLASRLRSNSASTRNMSTEAALHSTSAVAVE